MICWHGDLTELEREILRGVELGGRKVSNRYHGEVCALACKGLLNLVVANQQGMIVSPVTHSGQRGKS